MIFRTIGDAIRSEWNGMKPLARIGVISAIVTIFGGLMTASNWAVQKAGWDHVAPPLRSKEPEYFDVNNLARYAKWGIDSRTALKIALMLRTENQLDDARELLLDVRDRLTIREGIDFVNGLITATWYGQEKHRAGLEFLGEITRNLPPNDFRYRFQFHAHLQAIKSREGMDAAEKVIDEMRREYHRVEYTRVWLGVPLANMESLYRGTDAKGGGPPALGEEERLYLEQLVQDVPHDPFIDHALYFLGETERVIREHPQSLLRPTAMELRIYECVDCAENPATCQIFEAQSRLKQFGQEYPEMLADARIHAAWMLARAGRVTNVEEIGCAGSSNCDRTKILEGALTSPAARAVDVIMWLGRTDPRLLELKLDKIMIELDEAFKYVQRDDYRGAVETMEKCAMALAQNGLTPTPAFIQRMVAFKRLEKASTRTDAEGYFELGLAEAEVASVGQTVEFTHMIRNNAADSFQRAQELAPGTELAAKASYLRAMAYRRIQNYDASLTELDHFLKTYPNSPLYDDVLAEKGVHGLTYASSALDPDEIFAEVASRFPAGNAADNALTWMARSREQDCRFSEAMEVFERIAARYPATRLGIAAHQKVLSLIPVVRTRTYRSVISGLSISRASAIGGAYVQDVLYGSVADNANMTAGDVIVEVGDQEVTDAASYYAAMSAHEPEGLIRLKVRGSDGERYVRTTVSASDYYPAAPPSISCID